MTDIDIIENTHSEGKESKYCLVIDEIDSIHYVSRSKKDLKKLIKKLKKQLIRIKPITNEEYHNIRIKRRKQ